MSAEMDDREFEEFLGQIEENGTRSSLLLAFVLKDKMKTLTALYDSTLSNFIEIDDPGLKLDMRAFIGELREIASESFRQYDMILASLLTDDDEDQTQDDEEQDDESEEDR